MFQRPSALMRAGGFSGVSFCSPEVHTGYTELMDEVYAGIVFIHPENTARGLWAVSVSVVAVRNTQTQISHRPGRSSQIDNPHNQAVAGGTIGNRTVLLLHAPTLEVVYADHWGKREKGNVTSGGVEPPTLCVADVFC